MAEIYYKIPGSILTEIADALRDRKGTTKKYAPEEFAKVILSMVVKPVETASAEATIVGVPTAVSAAVGVLPTIHKGVASVAASFNSFTAETNAVGIIVE